MSEATDNKDDVIPETTEAAPAPKTRWQRSREWLFAALLLFVISSAVDAMIGFISGKKPVDCDQMNSAQAKKVCENDQKTAPTDNPGMAMRLSDANQYVSKSVNSLDPFNFAKIFYGYLLNGVPPGTQVSEPMLKAGRDANVFTYIFRAIPGAYYTILAIASTGWVSIITALIALLFGYAVQRSSWKDDDYGYQLISLLFVPIIGGAFIWGLIQLMSLATYLFGSILNAAEASTAFSVLGTTVWAMFKKTENDSTDKFIKWSKERIFT